MRPIIYYTRIIFIILLFFQGCESKEKLPADKLARIYVDILIAEQTYIYDADSLQIAVEQVYKNNGITKAEYEKGISKFKADEEKWEQFFEIAKNYLDSLKSEGSRPRT